jgi:hypothetical protein
MNESSFRSESDLAGREMERGEVRRGCDVKVIRMKLGGENQCFG